MGTVTVKVTDKSGNTATDSETYTVSSPVTVTEAIDFAAANNSGFWRPNGVQGAGVDADIYQLKANTSTHAAEINAMTSGTNPYRVMKVGSTNSGAPIQGLVVSDFTLQGTPQGSNYGGLDILYADNPSIHDLNILGPIPGNAPGPPGETFVLHTQRTNNPQFTDLLLDGHDTTGARAAGTINGNSYLPNGGTWTRVKHTGALGGFGTAIFQASHGTFTWTDCEWADNRQHFNLEDSMGDAAYKLVRPKFDTPKGDGRYLMQISSKTSSAKVTITDPVIPSWPFTVRWYPNGGTQVKSDIRLVLNGVDVSNDTTKLAFINF